MAKVSIISLGCPRNRTDSEVIAGSLKKAGFSIVEPDSGCDVCVINTCAFIESAREESIQKILEAGDLKKRGSIGRLVICGCLPQLYKEKLSGALSEADLILGTGDFPKIAELLNSSRKPPHRSVISREPKYLYDDLTPRIALEPRHYAYLKISEGCSNFCSYCIISRLRGAFRSRSIESVVREAENLSAGGTVKEIDLIGQDTTLFGVDRYGKIMFADLLKKICAVKGSAKWIRILYTHPAHYSDRLISVIRDEEKICKYLDLPIQHISDSILRRMNRGVTKKETILLIEKLRKRIPGLALRTSIITGFPGETEKDFKELLDFLDNTEFERLGAFTYSREEGTRASKFGKQVPEEVKKDRFDAIMTLQKSISLKKNKGCLGKVVKVLIDEPVEGERGVYSGRTCADAPEIDCAVQVSGKGVKVGGFCMVKITGAMEYDLAGNIVI